MQFYIDTYTKGNGELIRRLNRLHHTEATFDGMYMADYSLCRILVDTSKTEAELEHWLWKTKGVDYIGVCEVKV